MKPSTHEKLTTLAVQFYTKQAAGRLASLLDVSKYYRALLQGAADEDDPTVTRGLNWHFYPANDTLARADRDFIIFTLRPTSLHITEKRQEEVVDHLDDGASKGLFKAMGRVLHHLQDMSTPSHVVPVYHGPKVADPYESFLEEQWPQLEPLLAAELAGVRLSDAPAGQGDFVALYQQGAKRLLASLEEGQGLFPLAINAQGVRVESRFFWRSHGLAPSSAEIPFDIEGFGSFGELGEKFGNCSSCLIAGKEEAVDDAVYRRIAVHYLKAAVLDSALALQHLEELMAAEPAFAG